MAMALLFTSSCFTTIPRDFRDSNSPVMARWIDRDVCSIGMLLNDAKSPDSSTTAREKSAAACWPSPMPWTMAPVVPSTSWAC